MTKTVELKKSKRTENLITSVYIELINNKRWDKITVKELCLGADITRGTFYQYYNDIYDLMEKIQDTLIDDLNKIYKTFPNSKTKNFPSEKFDEHFNYSPTKSMIVWLKFCKKNKKAVFALLDKKNGNTYFVKKLQKILSIYINDMMDEDGFPRDKLRDPFVNLFLEMHFLVARIWLEGEDDKIIEINDINYLLNSTRVGANYLAYKESEDPNFKDKMDLTQYLKKED